MNPLDFRSKWLPNKKQTPNARLTKIRRWKEAREEARQLAESADIPIQEAFELLGAV